MKEQPPPMAQDSPLRLERIAARAPRAHQLGTPILVDGMLRDVFEGERGPFYKTESGRRVHFGDAYGGILVSIKPRMVWGNYGSGYKGCEQFMMYVSKESPLYPRSSAARAQTEVMHYGAHAQS